MSGQFCCMCGSDHAQPMTGCDGPYYREVPTPGDHGARIEKLEKEIVRLEAAQSVGWKADSSRFAKLEASIQAIWERIAEMSGDLGGVQGMCKGYERRISSLEVRDG